MSRLAFGETFGQVVSGPATARLPATLSLHLGGDHTPHHQHDQAYICVVLAGGFAEDVAGAAFERRAGQAVLHPPGTAHADRFDIDGALCLNLHIRGFDAPPDAFGMDPVSRSLAEALAAEIARSASVEGMADVLAADALAAELAGRLTGRSFNESVPTWVGQVIEALGDDPDRDWSLAELARIAQRHPTQVARGFRQGAGLSIGAFRRRRRLTRLALDLSLGRDALAGLAARHGYADQAHMTREFRRFAGCAPGAFRAAR